MEYVYIFIFFYVIIVIIICGIYFSTRKSGCLDRDALNYNPTANIHVPTMCNYDLTTEEALYGSGVDTKGLKVDIDLPSINLEGKTTGQTTDQTDQTNPTTGLGTYLVDPEISGQPITQTTISTTPTEPGCAKEWSSNYNLDNPNQSSIKKCLTVENILDKLLVWSSQSRSIVVFEKRILVNHNRESITAILFDRSPGTLTIKGIKTFNTNQSTFEIESMVDFINSADTNDILVMCSNDGPFTLFFYNVHLLDRYFKALKPFGMRKKNLTQHSNYIFVGSKKGDIYFEKLSDNPISYPEFEINSYSCKTNPADLFPPEDYFVFDERVPQDERVYRCMIETTAHGYNEFGIVDNNCIPINPNLDTTYLSDDSRCMNGIGTGVSKGFKTYGQAMAIYKIDKNNIQKVRFFNDRNFEGEEHSLHQGDFHPEFTFRSMSVPIDFYLYLVKKNRIIKAYYGYVGIKDTTKEFLDFDYDMISIRKHYPNSVIICDGTNCATFGPGRHVISPHLFMRVTEVKMSRFTKKVVLYNDIQLVDLVDRFINTYSATGQLHYQVKVPKYVRGIEIL